MAQRFSGKAVLITGASSGIGAAAARQFAREGAQVALVARTAATLEQVAEEVRAAGGSARAFPADVKDAASCGTLLDAVAKAFGGIDVLVNNAGANKRGLVVNAAKDLRDLAQPPNNKLEALKKDRTGQHAIRINDQWRVCFVWRDGNAYDVEIVDYH